ncbi:MAG: hypothetical protein A2Y72_00225 [Chloroflexi bacterium RBG_13_53_26]|jgi:prepilin-type N-terminal cleavage/methylation domain-containing protein|nr:MAG: hypothetical protein A2Y72_00225 [Chloroflexi bacterium RBG_13_53_26]
MKRKLFGRGQKGFTLVELLVVIPIMAVVVAGATAGLIQVLHSRDASSRMVALRQVQTAGYWVSTDGLQADSVTLTAGDFPLTLVWTDPYNDEMHTVTYTVTGLSGNQELERHAVVVDISTGATISDTTLTVASQLTQATCQQQVSAEGQVSLIFFAEARVRQETESRTYDIKPRSLSL